MPKNTFYNISKRIIDILGSLLLITVFSPILIITIILIKISSPGPIIFKQKRVGMNSKEFWMYKFRSMFIGDNDKRLKKNYPHLWEKYKNNGWKLEMSEDPRITPIGKIIRSLTIDEFPQILNVLRGDMSLVGPRAYREEELQDYAKKFPHTKVLIDNIRSAKPGITGVWQTSGRNDISFEQRAKLDSAYIKKKSILLDLVILFKTPLAMFSRW